MPHERVYLIVNEKGVRQEKPYFKKFYAHRALASLGGMFTAKESISVLEGHELARARGYSLKEYELVPVEANDP